MSADNPTSLTRSFKSQYLSSKTRGKRGRKEPDEEEEKEAMAERELREALGCRCRTRRQWQWNIVVPLLYCSLQCGENLSAPNQWEPFNIQSK